MKIVASVFSFYILWLFCKYSTMCNFSNLNRRVHITINSKLFDFLLLNHSVRSSDSQTQHFMGVLGIVSYLTLIPTAVYLWIKDGAFLLLVSTGTTPLWYKILFLSQVIIFTSDYWIGYFFEWRAQKRTEKLWRRPAIPREILWSNAESKEIRCHAERIFHAPDKVIWDMDVQEYYYLQGKMLLRIRKDGLFVSLTHDADSPHVLKAMRTGIFIKF